MYIDYYQTISKGIRVLGAQAFPYKIHSMEITQKASKGEKPFLHATHRLDLIYMPTKYYQSISKGFISQKLLGALALATERLTDVRLIATPSPEPCRSVPEPCRCGDNNMRCGPNTIFQGLCHSNLETVCVTHYSKLYQDTKMGIFMSNNIRDNAPGTFFFRTEGRGQGGPEKVCDTPLP